jgi:hypothetical protein
MPKNRHPLFGTRPEIFLFFYALAYLENIQTTAAAI